MFVEPAEQGLVEAFVLALRGGFIGFPGDRLNPEPGDQLTDRSATASVDVPWRPPIANSDRAISTMSARRSSALIRLRASIGTMVRAKLVMTH